MFGVQVLELSIVVGDAIRGPYLQDFSFSSAGGGVVRLDRIGTAWDSFGLVLAAASGRLFAAGPHQLAVCLGSQYWPVSFFQSLRVGSRSLFQQSPASCALLLSVLSVTERAQNHELYCARLEVGISPRVSARSRDMSVRADAVRRSTRGTAPSASAEVSQASCRG